MLATTKRRYDVFLADDQETAKSMTSRGLRKTLSSYAVDGQVRCVVMQPAEPGAATTPEDEALSFSPLQRLWQFLKPEAADIWLVLIFAFVVSLLALATPVAVEELVNTVAFGSFLQPIVVLAVILLMFLVFQGAIRGLQTYVVEILQRRLFARVTGDLAYRLPRTEIDVSDEHYAPELANRFFDVVSVQKIVAKLLPEGLGLVLSTSIGMAVLGFYHPWLLGFDLFLIAAITFVIFVLGRGAISSAVKESKHKYYMAAWFEISLVAQPPFATTAARNSL